MENNCNKNCDCEICGICCHATDCVHNDDKRCMAGHINIGSSNAKTSSETDCETFKAR